MAARDRLSYVLGLRLLQPFRHSEYRRLIAALAFGGALLMGGMALWITYEVLMRYFLERPTFWAVDLSEYAMLWAAFLAAPWVLRCEGHVRVEVFVERRGGRRPQLLWSA